METKTNYFKQFLTENGLSQYRVAQVTGISKNSINRMYKGFGMRADSAIKINRAFPDFDLSKIRPDLWG